MRGGGRKRNMAVKDLVRLKLKETGERKAAFS